LEFIVRVSVLVFTCNYILVLVLKVKQYCIRHDVILSSLTAECWQ